MRKLHLQGRIQSVTLIVELVGDASAGEVVGAGPAHPIVGAMIDVGAWALIQTLPGLDPAEWLASACAAVAGEGGQLALRPTRWRAQDPERVREALENEIETGPVIVAAPGEGQLLVVIAGPGLPALGEVGLCDRTALVATLRQLAGLNPDGESLLEERVAVYNPDHQVDRRLRQLYGE